MLWLVGECESNFTLIVIIIIIIIIILYKNVDMIEFHFLYCR